MSDLKQLIRTEAIRLGFSHCGFAKCSPLDDLRPHYSDFIRRKGHAGLAYLETHAEKRLQPDLVMKGANTVIALLMNYFPPEIIPETDNFIISKYAYGADYHTVLKSRLQELTGFLASSGRACRARAFADSGVVLEKAWAQRCGVGWQGKNTLIINRSGGSFFFIGIILTTLEIEPDVPEQDHCGSCRLCAEACPTGALDVPWQLDIPKCISYLTIETDAEIPAELKGKLRDRIYGCDICQDVCPYNRFARPHQTPEFIPAAGLVNLRKKDWIGLSEADFDRIFTGSPLKRSGYHRLKRVIPTDTNPPQILPG